MTNSNTNTSTHTLNIPTLADRAVLVQLTRKRMRTSRRATDIENDVRDAANDESLTVFSHVFQGKNPVRTLLREYDAVYALHKKLTSDWVNRGPRVLPNYYKDADGQYKDNIQRYFQKLNRAMDAVTAQVPSIQSQWDVLVQSDINARMKKFAGHGPLALKSVPSVSDYPRADEVPQLFSFALRVFPIPSTGDFRVEVDDMVRQSLNDALREAEDAVRQDAIRSMLKPLQAAVEKLGVPIGTEGSIFRDSLVENIREGAARARDLNIGNDPEIERTIQELENVLGVYVPTPDALRHSQTSRDKTKDELDRLLSKIGVL